MNNELTYPTTFKNAETASSFHKKNCILLEKIKYGAIILASFIAIFPFNSIVGLHWPSLFSGLALLTAIVVLFVEKNLEHQKGWYESRALAEAVKAESWKFRCACGYYLKDRSESDIILDFLKYLSKIRTELPSTNNVTGCSIVGNEISHEMKNSRSLPLKERAILYKNSRIEEQIRWYSDKAKTTSNNYRNYFIGAVGCLLAGVTFAGARFLGHLNQFSFAGFLSAVTLTLFGWMQIRRYETLSIAYTKVVTELRAIAQALTDTVQDDKDLDICVRDAELVISKEHTIWVTKGEVV
ncbi:DUF4231 domain-containing protein [Candidatus Omnitrophota bacterium]